MSTKEGSSVPIRQRLVRITHLSQELRCLSSAVTIELNLLLIVGLNRKEIMSKV